MESINNKSKDSKIDYSIRHPKAPLDRARKRMITEQEKRELEREDSISRWRRNQEIMRLREGNLPNLA